MTDTSRRWDEPMLRALELATGPQTRRGANPRVGCVIVDEAGESIAEGRHRGAGTPHAEVEALVGAGERARGATAIVTLEPCRHVGRTGPCVDALLAAGISRVVFAQADPTTQAGGGADVLRRHGVEVIGGVRADAAWEVNRGWTSLHTRGRPFVTVKSAMSLDGRVAGPDGGPTPITGAAARAAAHERRAECDAIVVGTGTVLIDDPQLTVRDPAGVSAGHQPLRVVVGRRELPGTARVLDDAAETLVLRTRDLHEVMRTLADRGVQEVLVEGGPELEGAVLEAGLADAVLWFLAPIAVGRGPVSLPLLTDRWDVDVRRIERVGEDVLIEGRLARAAR